MRIIRYAVCLMIILCITSIGFTQMRTKDAMVKHIFSAFKNKDSNAYAGMIPRLPVFKEMMIDVWVTDLDSAEAVYEKEEVDAMTDEDVRDARDFAKEEFNSLIDRSTQKGIDWKNAKMTGWKKNKSDYWYDEPASFKVFAGIISFSSGGKKYKIEFRNVMWSKTDKCWYAPETYAVYEVGKEKETIYFSRRPPGNPKF